MSTFTKRPPLSGYEKPNSHSRSALNMTANLINDDWELLDPTPDVNSMFKRFDDRFFESKLRCVELEWSKKMYSCAGICYSRRSQLGQSITIRLSEPLLKLRPRKDLVQTLLHEMIHALAFIKGVREGNGGHGPFFHKMMYDINKVAGTNITVYHTFIDEVNVYKKHIWRCNGMCQHRKPFFGYVRRVSNRAPGPSDQWWASHEKECGGYFKKVGEPEGKPKAPKKTAIKPVDNKQPKINDAFRGVLPTSQPPRLENVPESTAAGGPAKKRTVGANIRGFADLSSGGDNSPPPPNRSLPEVPLFKGPGHTLNTADRELERFRSIQDQVRASWDKRFGGAVFDSPSPPSAKKPKVPPGGSIHQWQIVDSDIAIKTPYVEVVELLDSDSEEEDSDLRDHNDRLHELANKTVAERKASIKRELMDDDDEENEGQIEMIDDEFDDTLVAGSGGGGRTATRRDGGGEEVPPIFDGDDIVKCPICEGGVYRNYLSQHMEEGCLGIRQKVAYNIRADAEAGPSSRPSTFTSPPAGSATARQSLQREDSEGDMRFPCPNCHMRYSESRMNVHLDTCLFLD